MHRKKGIVVRNSYDDAVLVDGLVIIYKLLRVMNQVGTVSWKLRSVCDEAIWCDSRFQRFLGRNYISLCLYCRAL